MIAPLQFLLVETITAAAWSSPRYSYFSNFISDLGVINGPITYQDRLVDSPLGYLMDASFAVLGLFGAAGIALLTRSLRPSAHRTWIRAGGMAFGVGGVLVGAFPENSVELMHALGAFLNIGFGNILLILVGARGERHYGLPRPLARLVLALGILGTVALVAMVSIPALFNGAVERTAAYPYMATLIGLSALALTRSRTQAVSR